MASWSLGDAGNANRCAGGKDSDVSYLVSGTKAFKVIWLSPSP